jgi:hypothetical protein
MHQYLGKQCGMLLDQIPQVFLTQKRSRPVKNSATNACIVVARMISQSVNKQFAIRNSQLLPHA